ncbi:MAG: TetR family transcriptional regulator [Rhizobiaceae bacterium]|nr:TetR family transcriptional regulator [Rhizobiaceae bacterium]
MAKRDRARSERNILKAARMEFAKSGYAGARVEKIGSRAKVSKGMIYHCFGSKDGLFVAVLEELYQRLNESNGELVINDCEPVEGIQRLTAHTFRYFAENPEFIILVNSENLMKGKHLKKSKTMREMFRPVYDKLDYLLKTGAEQGIFRKDVETTHFYISIVALGYFFLSNRYTLGVVFDSDLFSEDILDQRLQHIQEIVLGYLSNSSDQTSLLPSV